MRLTFAIVAVCMSSACVGAPPPPPSDDDGSSSSTAGPSDTTSIGPTTGTGEGTAGTIDGTGSTSNNGTTVGVSATDGTTTDGTTTDGTTMGVDPVTSGSSSGNPPPECAVSSDCPNNETCDGVGQCVPACNPWGAGGYDYCLTSLGTFDAIVLCGEALSCITGGNPLEAVVCGRTCTTQCDCAEPPPTGDATVTCGDITGGGDRCYLSCENGETCPDAMVCRNGTYCAHPVQPLAMYGDCGAVAAPCANGGTCSTQTDGMTTWSVCVGLCPGGIGDCDAAPAGAAMAAHCDGVISPPMGADCHLDCLNSADCLPGMDCVDTGFMGHSTLCMWPQ